MLRLSVILPMYNVAPYVEKCIRSLEHQDISPSEYEILCVNDGSPDNCREIVLQLQQEFSNIRLIDQENQGVSRARNNAMDKAVGNYILFIDPDDYVDRYSFNRVVTNAEKRSAQIAFLGYTFLNEDETVRTTLFHENYRTQIYSGLDAYFVARADGKTDPDRLVGVLFERSFLNKYKLRYLSDVPYLEDGELMARMMCLAERCIFDGYSFYQRTTRVGSATNSNLFESPKAISGFLNCALNLKKFQQEFHLSLNQKVFLNQPIVKFTLLIVVPFCRIGSFLKFLKAVSLIKEHALDQFELKNCNGYYKIDGRLFLIHPMLFYLHKVLRNPLFRFVHYKF